MKKVWCILSILTVFATHAQPINPIPQTDITNGLIHARFYLPDAKDGYYRGSRFDWSGVMPQLEYQGHTYFGQWFEKYSPTIHDAIMGPVEAFSPAGYDEVKAGENFLVVGIGMVSKVEEPKYSFVTPYQIVNSGFWKVKKKSDKVEFVQKLTDKEYAYDYKKTVQLIKGKPEMVLTHTLKNTGKRTIVTNVYDHNFFVMDKQPTGPNFVVKFPFNLKSEAPETGQLGKIQDNQIIFLKELSQNDHLFYQSLTGFSDSAKDYDIKIENHKTGAAVRITSDQPLFKIVFWSAQTTLCPEPYIHVKVNPGEEFSWKIFYEFYTVEKKTIG